MALQDAQGDDGEHGDQWGPEQMLKRRGWLVLARSPSADELGTFPYARRGKNVAMDAPSETSALSH
jgi:hypothetical protein